uniref:G-patch domain-containing protein n=1 Tax=Gongylonema pulchrum TaxID=637853 RepID=A0A183EBU7_9BILA
LLREIPLNCTETKIQAEVGRVSSLEVLRVHIAESGLYAYVQMRSADDAERLMLTFNKAPLLIDGCAVMVTYSRLPLNTVLSTTAAAESMQKAAERISQMPAFKPQAGSSGNAGVEAAQLAIAKAQLIRQMTSSIINNEKVSGNAGVEAAQLAIAKAQLIRQMTSSIINNEKVSPQYAGVSVRVMLNRRPLQMAQATNFVVFDYFKDREPPLEQWNYDSEDPADREKQRTMSSSYTGPQIKGAADLGEVETPWGRYKRYHAPNPTIYQYEPSSGLYYDPSTGLYYDSNSQYYWDTSAQKWNCWNATYQTYIPCDAMTAQSEKGQETSKDNGGQNSTGEKTDTVKDEPKKEPQKTAKDIAREMARWAKRQSKVLLAVKAPAKLETTSPLVTNSKPKASVVEPTADITFKMLEKTNNPFGSLSDEDEEEEMPPLAKIAAVGASRPALNSRPAARLEPNTASLPPPAMAEPKNLEAHLLESSFGEGGSVPLLSATTSQTTSLMSMSQPYRDRAKERRNLFGLDPSGFTSDVPEIEPDYAVRSSDIPIDETNIGSKLLKSMGWQEGTGIGKNNQGIYLSAS